MNDLLLTRIQHEIAREWKRWPESKNEVRYFGFKEYIKGECGLDYHHGTNGNLAFTVVNEKKFSWFLLRLP